MQFYRPRKPIPAIPIVALIDILVILLIFFIVTMQPKQKRTILDISMPTVGGLATKKVVEPRTVLALSKDGEITIDSTRIHPNMLDDYLAELKKQDRKLELEMDKQVRLEQMIMISEALSRAGFKSNLPTRVRDAKQLTDS